jgi:hypothetical protein
MPIRRDASQKEFDVYELRRHALAGALALAVCALAYDFCDRLTSVRCAMPEESISQLHALVSLQADVLFGCGFMPGSDCPASINDFALNLHRLSSLQMQHLSVCIHDAPDTFDVMETL